MPQSHYDRSLMKEKMKWLDSKIIYPISNSSWVSPIRCVPKKGRLTIVVNQNNELIPTKIGYRLQKTQQNHQKNSFSLTLY